MQDTLFTYDNEFEQAFAVAESALELEMARCEMAYEYAENLYNVKIAEADLKVMNESGTYDDLGALYEDAAATTGEKKQGVVASIFTAIRNFIANIFSSIAKLFGKKDEETINNAIKSGQITDVQVDTDPEKATNLIVQAWNQMKKFISPAFTKDNGNGERVFSIARTLTTGLAAVGFAVGAKKGAPKLAKKIKGSKLYDCYRKLKGTAKDVGSSAEDMEKANMNPENKQALGMSVKEFASLVGKTIMIVGGDLKGAIGKGASTAASKVKGAAAKPAAKVKEALDEAKAEIDAAKNEADLFRKIYNALVAKGIDKDVANNIAKQQASARFHGESAEDDLDSIYDEMDIMESTDFNESCEEIFSILESM